jgi:lysophospholipase L1-like esterase
LPPVTGIRKPVVVALLSAALAIGALVPASASASPFTPAPGAKPHQPVKLLAPVKVEVGRVVLGTLPEGTPAVLVAIRYPIQALGREMSADIRVAIPGRDFRSIATDIVGAGGLRKGDRRRSFTFVHEFPLHPRVAAAVLLAQSEGKPVRVRVTASGAIDVNGDGKPDITSADHETAVLPLTPLVPSYGGAKHPNAGKFGTASERAVVETPAAAQSSAAAASTAKAAKPFCASIPHLRLHPGQRVEYPLPACTAPVTWKVETQPGPGSARVAREALVIQAPKQPAPMTIGLSTGPPVQVTVVEPKDFSVRAIGDSVTAGYGYYDDAREMPIYRLPECKPLGTHLNDACSSNSTATRETGVEEPISYAPDYGLANNVSWAAQWANAYGITDYENLAVTGSEPKNWAPGGDLYATTKAVEAENPDYILMTMGANPILAETLFGLDPMGCAIYADIFGEYNRCVERAFAKVNLRGELHRLYADLVEHSTSTIYLMQYHLSIPSSALAYTSTQIAETAALMNQTIAEVAAEVSPTRLQVVTPPHFNVGVNIEPVAAASYECGELTTDHVDGPSVQSAVTQAELHLFHPVEFCPQAEGEVPWVISGDTGIHPSAEGYFHMASRIPAPN